MIVRIYRKDDEDSEAGAGNYVDYVNRLIDSSYNPDGTFTPRSTALGVGASLYGFSPPKVKGEAKAGAGVVYIPPGPNRAGRAVITDDEPAETIASVPVSAETEGPTGGGGGYNDKTRTNFGVLREAVSDLLPARRKSGAVSDYVTQLLTGKKTEEQPASFGMTVDREPIESVAPAQTVETPATTTIAKSEIPEGFTVSGKKGVTPLGEQPTMTQIDRSGAVTGAEGEPPTLRAYGIENRKKTPEQFGQEQLIQGGHASFAEKAISDIMNSPHSYEAVNDGSPGGGYLKLKDSAKIAVNNITTKKIEADAKLAEAKSRTELAGGVKIAQAKAIQAKALREIVRDAKKNDLTDEKIIKMATPLSPEREDPKTGEKTRDLTQGLTQIAVNLGARLPAIETSPSGTKFIQKPHPTIPGKTIVEQYDPVRHSRDLLALIKKLSKIAGAQIDISELEAEEE